MNEKIVDLKNVWFYRNDIPVLEDVSLEIEKNILLGVIGPNGGGKTTLLKVILGLIEPDRGEVKILGKNPGEIGDARKFIGYLPQHTLFDPKFPISVFDTVLMGRYKRVFRNYSDDDRKAAKRALETMDMLEFKDRQIGSLSGGQLQRVFLARALTREPKLLLLDEPTAGIDPEMQESFYELLSRLKKKMAIVLVTHDISVVSVYVDEVACLNRRLFYHGSTEIALKELGNVYQCPIELIAHGTPHRVLGKH